MSPSQMLPTDWQLQFDAALTAWASVGQAVLADEDARADSWASDFDRMLQVQRGLEAQGSWLTGPNDLLGIIGLHRWERAHSAALGWLLDPTGAHGLGAALLDRFLQRSGLAESNSEEPVEVVLEAAGGTAFVDVLVRSRSWTLVIEVKIDAPEQEEQALRLWSDWRDEVTPAFVYLTPSGRETTTHVTGECKKAWTLLPWRDVARDLRALLQSPEAASARGNDAARQYAMTLQSLFGRN